MQENSCHRLAEFLERIARLKRDAVREKEEDLANILLGFECATHFLRSSIEMWVLLKKEQFDKAWEALVNAQMAVSDAVRAHKGFAHLSVYAERLSFVEETLFPPQLFTSPGLIVKSRKCSICLEEYGECCHLVGKPYMGQLCCAITTDIERIDHIAIVSNPSKKIMRIP